MLLQELLGICEEVYLVEESYADQRTIPTTMSFMESIRSFLEHQSLRIIRIKTDDRTLAILIFNPKTEDIPVDFWSVFTNSIAKEPYTSQFESLADSILALNPPEKEMDISPDTLRDAVNEYYSIMLVNHELCPVCTVRPEAYDSVFSQDRVKSVLKIFENLGTDEIPFEGRTLEVCCGNGMSTIGLHKLGLEPISVEIDKCTVCQGLEHDVLNPKRTLVMDATTLSKYFEPDNFDTVIGFMLGQVYEFNRNIWEGIMREAAKVAKKGAWMLFTVRSETEADILQHALNQSGVEGEIMENKDSDGVYDQWLFVGRKI